MPHPLSIQLYCARKFPPVERQLEIVAASGYKTVETFGPFHEDVAATKRLFEAHKITAPSGHVSLDMADGQRERVRDMAQALGMKWIVAPFLMPNLRPQSPIGWAELGTRLARLADYYASVDLGFAWHNHDFEFQPLADGSLPIEHILGGSVAWQADIAWIVRGQADPKRWLERYAGRVKLAHVKDIAPAGEKLDEDGWADVGQGVLPWPELWKAVEEAGAEIFVAEHDNPSDFERFARVSIEAMRRYDSGA